MPNSPTRTFLTARPLGSLVRSSWGVLVCFGALLGAGAMTSSAQAQDAFDSGAEQALLERLNEVREQAGSGPLARDGMLDAAARTHSTEMAAADQLMHVSAHTGTPIDRVHTAGLATDEVAENVAMHSTADAAQQALEASDAHLANMLNPRFTHVGIAAARDEGGIYVTQVFARIESAPLPAVAPPASPAPFVAPPIVAQAAPMPAVAPPMGPPAIASPGLPVAPAVSPPAPSAASGPAGAPGQVLTVRTADGATQGYWVCGSGRWWYYPLPAGTTSGQLQADLSMSGSPPGFGACTPGPGGPAMAVPAPGPGVQYQGGYSARAYGPGAYGGVYGSPGAGYPPRYAPAPPATYHQPRVVVPGAVIGPWGGAVYGAPQYGPQYGPQYAPQYAPQPYAPQPYGRRVIIRRR